MKSRIAIQLETKGRELQGKLWLAKQLVSDGYEVVIGEAPELMGSLDLIRPDVLIVVSAGGNRQKVNALQALRAAGVVVVVLDVEGGVFRTDEGYSVRLGPEVLDQVDRFLAWGPRPAELVTQMTGFPAENVSVTGEPKFDLLSERYRGYYEDDARTLRDEYGDYALINTNFGMANHFDTSIKEHLMTDDDVSRIRKPIEEFEFVEFQALLIREFIDAVSHLAGLYQDMNFVIRPHPSESHRVYEESFPPTDNVFVTSRGNVHSWVLGAKCVIHNNCTTAIEALLLECPAIAYCPIHLEDYDLILPNEVSHKVATYSQLAELVGRARAAALPAGLNSLGKHARETFELYFYNTDGLGAQRVSRLIGDVLKNKPDSVVQSRLKEAVSTKARVKRTVNAGLGWSGAESLERLLVKMAGRGSAYAYRRQKFPGLSHNEVSDTLKMMDRVDRDSDLGGMYIERIPTARDCFVIKRGESAI